MQPHKNFNMAFREKAMVADFPPYFLKEDDKLRVMEALDHIRVRTQYRDLGFCSLCRKISSKTCSPCGAFYCSNECQTYDWPKHREICSELRDRVSGNSLESFKKSRPNSMKSLNDESMMLTNRSSPFTALTNQLNRKSGGDLGTSKSLANSKIGNKLYQSKKQIPKDGDAENSLNDGKDCKSASPMEKKKHPRFKKNFNSKNSVGDEKKSNDFKTSQSNGKSNDISTVRNSSTGSRVPKIENMEVITVLQHSTVRHWVMDVKNVAKYEEIKKTLKHNNEKCAIVDPEVDLVCCCNHDGEWFRCKVLSVGPKITVLLIDFGDTITCDVEALRTIPHHLQMLPGLVFLIEFDESALIHQKNISLTSLKLEIEETGRTSDGIPRVKIIEKPKFESEAKGNDIANGKSSGRRSVMSTLTSSSKGMLLLMPGEGATRYGSLIPDDDEEANVCIEKVLKIDNFIVGSYQAKDGDCVMVIDKEGNKQRGKVLSSFGSTCYVQLLDCGNVISVHTVSPLPEDLKSLVELGVKITIEEEILKNQVEKLDTCFFAITGECNSGKWPCLLKDTECGVIAKATLEQPPEKTDWEPSYVEIKSGSTVELSSATSPNTFYVCLVDGGTELRLFNMNMELMAYAATAKSVAIPPSAGELCCAKFQKDGCFYRCVVNSIGTGKANVLFVDFGNEQETDLIDIKPLPPSLKRFPFFAVKVRLSNVFIKSWNNMIRAYIAKITSENIELTLTYEKSISDGVILREKVSGVVVNEFIENATDKAKLSKSKKSSFDPSKKSEVFLEDDMQYTTITAGAVCDFAVLYLSDDEFKTNHTFWATVAGVKNFDYVNLELNSAISEHCSKMAAPYEPSYRELCLAEFEGAWYRAVCAGAEGDVFKVFFVDFGNVCDVKATSIRKMVKEFIKAPALAMNCTITGHERLKGNPDLAEKISRYLLEKVNTCIERVEVSKFLVDKYLLKIPEIEVLFA